MISLCQGSFVVFQVDAQNILGIVNRGSPPLKLNALARDLFWFGLDHRITLSVEWVPMEENTLADKLSKLLIPDESMPSRMFLCKLEELFGPHTVDLFVSGANNMCGKFYSLH